MTSPSLQDMLVLFLMFVNLYKYSSRIHDKKKHQISKQSGNKNTVVGLMEKELPTKTVNLIAKRAISKKIIVFF